MRMRQGMTLIELLVSLSLLAVLTAVAVSWMTTTLKTQAREHTQASWLRSSYAVLDLIEEDLIVVDRVGARKRQTPRVEIADGTLRIRTRDTGDIGTRVYSLDQRTSGMRRVLMADQTAPKEPPLLSDVERFVLEIEQPSEEGVLPTLRVALQGANDQYAERVYLLSREDIE